MCARSLLPQGLCGFGERFSRNREWGAQSIDANRVAPGNRSVRETRDNVHGEIASDWKLAGGQFSWKVRIPPNTTAIVYVPSDSGKNVMLDGTQLPNIKHEHGFFIAELGSGDYSFVSDFKKQ